MDTAFLARLLGGQHKMCPLMSKWQNHIPAPLSKGWGAAPPLEPPVPMPMMWMVHCCGHFFPGPQVSTLVNLYCTRNVLNKMDEKGAAKNEEKMKKVKSCTLYLFISIQVTLAGSLMKE